MSEPRTAAGKALLERESYNSRSFALITAEAILAIEEQAASQRSCRCGRPWSEHDIHYPSATTAEQDATAIRGRAG